ncbi:oxidoreductase [Rubinisphaera brasiliensis]|uniref:NADH:flavin oxidoreductase/NADH oxidase n=1 Tax=Rubinisphaera brasiliensis (strain ATCC 49424 / DSM 5305 / JCM 21570 / IAM 15109 / NBRC 103401 / IFAM 1448) TaxID=756272 RepID=F0SKZ6_RUBBR|nr:NADH:flavin oxidoreductase [Rubinisphaera brasiliensis]ADY59849.1 NADH:flavin oxidoreductase/NADH oxidase [Rubinisphaera brasiliensis DSM 5305]
MAYPRVASFKTVEQFRERLSELDQPLTLDDDVLSAEQDSPLAAACDVGGFRVGNRWAVHPMEGWDGTRDGKPSEFTVRRWEHFGESGCKLIWGGEAFAVRPDGRANPNQLYFQEDSLPGLETLLQTLRGAHEREFGAHACDDLLVGLQLTHSGRYCRPNEKAKLEPRIAYHHPLLDRRIGLDPTDDSALLTDDEVWQLIDCYVEAAKAAERIGFQFVDVKHCHGYLGHEFLSAFTRPGPFGGSFENRTRFLREICGRIRQECPNLLIGVRLSLFDMLPFEPMDFHEKTGRPGIGQPMSGATGDYTGFGCDRHDPMKIDLTEPIELMKAMRDEMGVAIVNITAGSPYYNPHIQRPAYFPPSDGYQPPEDPLVGCCRQLAATAEAKRAVPDLPIVGSAYTYFQEYLPHVGQAAVRNGDVDFVGLGRMVLSQWQLPAQTLRGEDYRAAKKICRTFSDCTTGPRNGLISGCYPLDDTYKKLPEFETLKQIKAGKTPS